MIDCAGNGRLEGKRALFGFVFGQRHHVNRVPGTPFKKGPVGAFAGAELAANAQQRVNDDAAHGWVVGIRLPEHAIFDGAIVHAGRRTRTARATFVDDGENVRLTFPLCRRPAGSRQILDNLPRNVLFDGRLCVGHALPPSEMRESILQRDASMSIAAIRTNFGSRAVGFNLRTEPVCAGALVCVI